MKKLILTIGAISATAMPVAAVIACNGNKGGNAEASTGDKNEYKTPTLGEMYKAGDASIKSLTGLGKNSTKGIAVAKVQETFKDKPDLKSLYTSFINHQESWMDAYYLIKFMAASSNEDSMKSGITGLAKGKTFAAALVYAAQHQEELIKKMKTKVLSGKLDFELAVKGIIDRFSGKDKDFNLAVVSMAATVKGKTLKKAPTAWQAASIAMGGDDVIKYILNKEGYKLA